MHLSKLFMLRDHCPMTLEATCDPSVHFAPRDWLFIPVCLHVRLFMYPQGPRRSRLCCYSTRLYRQAVPLLSCIHAYVSCHIRMTGIINYANLFTVVSIFMIFILDNVHSQLHYKLENYIFKESSLFILIQVKVFIIKIVQEHTSRYKYYYIYQN